MAFTTMALRPLFSTQGGASDLAKLLYNQNMKITVCGVDITNKSVVL